MTLNGEVVVILRHFTEFGSFWGILRKSGWQSHNYGQLTITMFSSKRRATRRPQYKFLAGS